MPGNKSYMRTICKRLMLNGVLRLLGLVSLVCDQRRCEPQKRKSRCVEPICLSVFPLMVRNHHGMRPLSPPQESPDMSITGTLGQHLACSSIISYAF